MLDKIRLNVKIMGGFSIMILLAMAIGIIGITRMATLNETNTRLYQQDLLGVFYLKEANIALLAGGQALRSALLTGNQAEQEKFVDATQMKLAETQKWIDQSGDLANTDKGREALKKMDNALREYEQTVNQILRTIPKENTMETRMTLDVLAELGKKGSVINELLAHTSNQQEALIQHTAENSAVLYEMSLNYMLGLITVTTVMGVLLGLAITRNLLRQLGGEPVFAAEIANRIASGDLSSNIQLRPGDNSSLMAAMRRMSVTLADVIAEIRHMSSEHDKGDIDVMINVSKFWGTFAEMTKGVNDMVLGHITVKKKAMACVKEFSEGNFNAELEKFPGKKAFINDNIEVLRSNLKTLMDELQRLIEASSSGQLSERGKVGNLKGDFAGLIAGINAMLDAILIPIGEGNRVLRLIRGGNLREKVEIDCKGEHEQMKNAVNGVHAWLTELVTYVTKIANGDMSANMNKASDGDQIHEWLLLMKNNIQVLVEDASMLSQAAVEGKLATRADAGKHQGDYRKIVEGVNATLDAVIGPLNVAADYVDRIAKGAIPPKITNSYNGDFDLIKNNLNQAIDAVNGLVNDAAMLSQAIVDGNLAIHADVSKHMGDYRKIIEAFEKAFIGLNNTFYQINDTVEQVSQTAELLNSASQNMAATSEEQSSLVEEMTSSLEETDSQVKANTDNANAANQLVIGASEAANQGQLKMEGMMEAMSAINISAQNIAKIIKVIDEIAFQTNLLALNAAVEAARAGQHGRGFAVVAQEVRNLAGRSAKAARETANLIEDSTKRVKEGVESAGNTREALNQIVTNVVKVKDLMAEIATASLEQSRGVTQINIAMNQVSQAAQTSSQQAEELASSATELSNVANQMRTEVNRFKLRVRQPGLSLSKAEKDELTRILMPTTAVETRKSMTPARHAVSLEANKPPKTVLPLDQDERGFGEF